MPLRGLFVVVCTPQDETPESVARRNGHIAAADFIRAAIRSSTAHSSSKPVLVRPTAAPTMPAARPGILGGRASQPLEDRVRRVATAPMSAPTLPPRGEAAAVPVTAGAPAARASAAATTNNLAADHTLVSPVAPSGTSSGLVGAAPTIVSALASASVSASAAGVPSSAAVSHTQVSSGGGVGMATGAAPAVSSGVPPSVAAHRSRGRPTPSAMARAPSPSLPPSLARPLRVPSMVGVAPSTPAATTSAATAATAAAATGPALSFSVTAPPPMPAAAAYATQTDAAADAAVDETRSETLHRVRAAVTSATLLVSSAERMLLQDVGQRGVANDALFHHLVAVRRNTREQALAMLLHALKRAERAHSVPLSEWDDSMATLTSRRAATLVSEVRFFFFFFCLFCYVFVSFQLPEWVVAHTSHACVGGWQLQEKVANEKTVDGLAQVCRRLQELAAAVWLVWLV